MSAPAPEAPAAPLPPVRTLTCCCCGEYTKGRQWHNRDTGYGLCVACIEYCAERTDPAEFEQCYGKRGIHFDCSESPSTTPGA